MSDGQETTGLPVRLVLFEQSTGKSGVGLVAASKFPLSYVFCFSASVVGLRGLLCGQCKFDWISIIDGSFLFNHISPRCC